MSATAPPVQTRPVQRTAQAIRDFRIIPRIETYPAAVAFVQTFSGKTLLLAVFALGLRLFSSDSAGELLVMLGLAAVTFMPEYRRFVLAVAPVAAVVAHSRPLELETKLAVIAFGMTLYVCVMRWPHSRFGRRPIAYLLTGFSILIVAACMAPAHSMTAEILWSAVAALAGYVWFIAYALSDRNSKPAKDFTLELTAFRPLWGSTNTPLPKGAAYLRRIEAHTPEQLAVTQLKGLKLLAWAIILNLLWNLWNRFFHVYLAIPFSAQSIALSVRGTPVAWHLRWESLILDFFEEIFDISCYGHMVIAICRMAGFNALRNTYRPLSSTTVAEFFNRYYYYYKELVVDFFFYPSFFRYWKRRPRLRLVFATFAAACFGNLFFHFTRDWSLIREVGFAKAAYDYETFAFYCFALAGLLSISQLRKKRAKPAGLFRMRILPAFRVCFIFCLLNIFGWSEQKFSLLAHFKYLASLFFIHF
jgi:hypothetical protein